MRKKWWPTAKEQFNTPVSLSQFCLSAGRAVSESQFRRDVHGFMNALSLPGTCRDNPAPCIDPCHPSRLFKNLLHIPKHKPLHARPDIARYDGAYPLRPNTLVHRESAVYTAAIDRTD